MIRVNPIPGSNAIPRVTFPSPPVIRIKTPVTNATLRLYFLFRIMALHSSMVGLALILHPAELINMSGFQPIGEEFFPVQGGVFHVLMAVLYVQAVLRFEVSRPLVLFSIFVKSSAFVFLLVYYFFKGRVPLVLLSGIVDGVMAMAIILAYHAYRGHPPGRIDEERK